LDRFGSCQFSTNIWFWCEIPQLKEKALKWLAFPMQQVSWHNNPKILLHHTWDSTPQTMCFRKPSRDMEARSEALSGWFQGCGSMLKILMHFCQQFGNNLDLIQNGFCYIVHNKDVLQGHISDFVLFCFGELNSFRVIKHNLHFLIIQFIKMLTCSICTQFH
jgi:hypothetical protein